MSKDIGCLKPSVNKAISRGIIDNWLRGVCALVPESRADSPPEPVIKGMDVTCLAQNTFILEYESSGLIKHTDIEKMDGYKQLLAAAAQHNVRLDFTDMGKGNLIVDFTPEEPFSKSTILGKSFTNVVPGTFGLKNR